MIHFYSIYISLQLSIFKETILKLHHKNKRLLPFCATVLWIFFILTPCSAETLDDPIKLAKISDNTIKNQKRYYRKSDHDALVSRELDAFEEQYLNELGNDAPKKSTQKAPAKENQTPKTDPKPLMNEEISPDESALIGLSEIDIDIYNEKGVIEESSKGSAEVHGEVRIGLGYDATNNDFLWKRANFDLNEKNWRSISWNQLNNRMNTYDPGIYSRLEFDIDAQLKNSDFSFHTNITIDPWSFTGKTEKKTVRGLGLIDSAEIQFYYWGNNGYTVGNNIFTLENGVMIAIPELKVANSYVPAGAFQSKFGNLFSYPKMKISNSFWPIREFWMDYKPTDEIAIQVFPYAYGDKALSSNDPLALSNNHIWWEESPWLANWDQGHINTGATPQDFMKGSWNDDLAFQTRDSDGRRLTALRGFSLSTMGDDTTMDLVVASPKHLWQDYDKFDAIPGSFRIQKNITDDFYIGNIENVHFGLVGRSLDAYNIVSGYDIGWLVNPGFQVKAEYAASLTEQDLSTPIYDTHDRGNAYDLSLVGCINGIESPDANYFAIQPEEGEKHFFKTQLRMTRMDKGFDSSLANYHETRDDQFWSRHITFRPTISFDSITYNDIQPFRLGNGIDYGRYVFNWRTDTSLWEGKLVGLTDFRNIHQTSTNKYIETVARTEWSYQATEKLQAKTLLIAHHLPDTTAGLDPYITDGNGNFINNAQIKDGIDPSAYTASLGLKYDFSKHLSWNAAYEYTNDFGHGADNYPRSILTDARMTTFQQYGMTYRDVYSYLYSQEYFPLPPYEYQNIMRSGLEINPNDQWNIYLDATYNPYQYAGPIDDNMNHVGCAVSYFPTKKIGLFGKYTWSRLKNVNDAVFNQSGIKAKSHHNVFVETQYLFDEESKLSVSYGVGPSIYTAYASSTPYMGSTTPTIDTQSIFRLFYTKKF